MQTRSTHTIAIFAILFLLSTASALPTPQGKGQSKGQKPGQQEKGKPDEGKGKEGQPAGKEEEEPLFKGKLGLKSSSQSKDQATLGFNGIGPDGKVQQAALEASPTGEDLLKAKQLSTYSVDSGELDYFLEEGKLKPPPAKQGQSRPRGDEVIATKREPATRKEETL